MKNYRNTFERLAMAVSFAEAAEHETAMSMANIQSGRKGKWREIFEKTFAATAFAEAGCPEKALDFMGVDDARPVRQPLDDFLRNVGLNGVNVRYGMVTVAC